jgi:competence protein ComEA
MRGIVAGLAVFLAAGAAQADEFPPGAMHDVVAKACTQCHSSSLITSSGKTREDWASTVTTMIGNGANVSDADFDKVVDYLAQSFPAK